MKETIKFIKYCKNNDVDFLWSFVMTPYPGTNIWEIAKERKKVSDDMNFDLLNNQAIDNPLLLDKEIPLQKFKKIFLEARKELDFTKYKIIKRNITLNPLESILDFSNKPSHYLKLIISKTTKYGDPTKNKEGNEFNKF